MYGELGIHQKESEKSSKEVNECMCGSMEGRWKKKKGEINIRMSVPLLQEV